MTLQYRRPRYVVLTDLNKYEVRAVNRPITLTWYNVGEKEGSLHCTSTNRSAFTSHSALRALCRLLASVALPNQSPIQGQKNASLGSGVRRVYFSLHV